ncbi:MAG: ABC transporter ATP-binding protein [Chloroflexi bacterium]|jgi:ABC-2 type transport system ATP-binding protein|nr:ABC transporter ATP-binding protein [Chloroflexota bacterium]MBT7080083.1 ABC transporter ATP-binding protein [Chloroflexota bacterium]MBT7290473.1 ABC transporter ATP-binding protein [Chloroflexota bacterium]
MTDAIVAENLTYTYGDLTAVDHINFNVAEGEIFGFLGPNGAGKSTTAKILTGQMKPKEGKALVLGMDVATNVRGVQSEIGVCFELPNMYEQMSAIENLKLFARLFGTSDFDGYDLLRRVDLVGREKDRVENYSKGMRQRLMVARALVSKPKVLFLDEPTSGLDPTSADGIRDIIRKERDRGATVFLTTHDMTEAGEMCDRVAFMNQGKLVALDTPHNLKLKYGKRALKAQVAGKGGQLEEREVVMDTADTAKAVEQLFASEKVVTVHSEEATLGAIFMQITGRGLAG